MAGREVFENPQQLIRRGDIPSGLRRLSCIGQESSLNLFGRRFFLKKIYLVLNKKN
jgi:hypothetical protein